MDALLWAGVCERTGGTTQCRTERSVCMQRKSRENVMCPATWLPVFQCVYLLLPVLLRIPGLS